MAKNRSVVAACLGAAAIVAAPAAAIVAAPAAAAGTAPAVYWKNKPDTYDCGIKAFPKGKKPSLLACSADAIPRGPKAPKDGDPGVQLGAHGKPKLINTFDSTFASRHQVVLATGSTWKDFGVTCKIGAQNVTCRNKDKHGFTAGHKTYKTF